jgi:hypothetical protein
MQRRASLAASSGSVRSSRLFVLALAALAGLAGLAGVACDNGSKSSAGNGAPPPPPPPSASAKTNACAGGGGEVKDATSTSFFPRVVGSFCVDPQGNEKVYGDKEKFSMDQVCTTAFDGECEVYKRFGLKRVVSLRYVDAQKPNSVEIYLNQFADAAGAYGMYTKRVVADADPIESKSKPLAAGGAGALGGSNAYVWKGPYLIELTFNSDDPNLTRDQMAAASQEACKAIGKAIADKLPGNGALLPAVLALPAANMLPMGVQFQPKDALAMTGIGAAAIGYYKEGEKRFRMVAMLRDDADQAKDSMKIIKSRPGMLPVKDVGDDAANVVVQEAPERAKSDYVFARKGNVVIGIGDEELVLKSGDAPEKQAALKLTKDEKIAKLRAWVLATATTTAPSASGSSAPAPPASGKKK